MVNLPSQNFFKSPNDMATDAKAAACSPPVMNARIIKFNMRMFLDVMWCMHGIHGGGERNVPIIK